MKSLLCILIFCASFLLGHAQFFKNKYFSTPNNIHNYEGILFLVDGQRIAGKISYDDRRDAHEVKLTKDDVNKSYAFKEIVGYQVKDDYYSLENIDPREVGIRYVWRFLKRITDSTAKIHLYQLQYFEEEWVGQSGIGQNKNQLQVITKYQYFVDLPSVRSNRLIWVYGSDLVNDFDTKAAAIFKDCALLKQKIAGEVYFYKKTTSLSKVRDIWLDIIKDYSACK